MKRFPRELVCAAVITAVGTAAQAQTQRLPDVTYMDQPTGIELPEYIATWPELRPYIERMKASQSAAVEADLRKRAAAPDVSDGELNLLAQLEWRHGDLAAADFAISKAVALRPKQPPNAFQQAMVTFAHFRRASGMLERWKWQQRTRDAYQRTFDLDPRNVSARYYLAYSYMNTPAIGGGDKTKALELSEGGIRLGQKGFYVVRADARRLRGELNGANADYNESIRLKVIKLGGFLDAAHEELRAGRLAQAKRYFDWALRCRPDAAQTYEGLGDYYASLGDLSQARSAYQVAVDKDPSNSSTKTKLEKLGHGK